MCRPWQSITDVQYATHVTLFRCTLPNNFKQFTNELIKVGSSLFYYLGRKKRLAGLYPELLFDLIVEPFAGSAAYFKNSGA